MIKNKTMMSMNTIVYKKMNIGTEEKEYSETKSYPVASRFIRTSLSYQKYNKFATAMNTFIQQQLA